MTLETFIFVHDQNIIIEFEKHQKFSNIGNYKYVFLGKGDIEKISDKENIIIARNYEDNIEQYPLFTSYTGWYLLWKNNLITTDYINLFEYDVILSDNFTDETSKLINGETEMIGYVPFLINHFQFIDNPEWNEYLLPAMKDIYNVDLKLFYNQILKFNPNSVWTTTSNTTFKKEIFNEFNEWFLPISEKIKETKTCGHAYERAISHFAYLNNKKLIITNRLLKHLQLNSHCTQEHQVDFEKELNKLYYNTTI
jgi:thymidine kinase